MLISLECRLNALETALDNGTGSPGSAWTKLGQRIMELIHRVFVAANAFLNQGLVTGSSHYLLDLHKGTMCCTGQCSALIWIPAQLRHNGLKFLNHLLAVLVNIPERRFY